MFGAVWIAWVGFGSWRKVLGLVLSLGSVFSESHLWRLLGHICPEHKGRTILPQEHFHGLGTAEFSKHVARLLCNRLGKQLCCRSPRHAPMT